MRAKKKTGWPQLSGDWLVCSDPHCPCQHDEYIGEMLSVARFHGIRLGHILGDLLDFDTLSRFEDKDTGQTTDDCINEGVFFLERARKELDRIVFTLGNHDRRIRRAMKSQLSAKNFERLLAAMC